MKNTLVAFTAVAGLVGVGGAASAQQFTLGAGHLEYRIINNNPVALPFPPGDDVVQLALQVRYVGGDVRVASLGATRGRIASNESDTAGR